MLFLYCLESKTGYCNRREVAGINLSRMFQRPSPRRRLPPIWYLPSGVRQYDACSPNEKLVNAGKNASIKWRQSKSGIKILLNRRHLSNYFSWWKRLGVRKDTAVVFMDGTMGFRIKDNCRDFQVPVKQKSPKVEKVNWADGVCLEEKQYKQHHSKFRGNCNQIKAEGTESAGGRQVKQTWMYFLQRQRCECEVPVQQLVLKSSWRMVSITENPLLSPRLW